MTLNEGFLDTLQDTEAQPMRTRRSLRNIVVFYTAVILVIVLAASASAEDRFTIEDSADWTIELLDGESGEPTSNTSASAGDRVQLSIDVANSDTSAGHDEWSFHMVLDGEATPELTGFLDGSEESVIVNISFGPLPEGEIHLIFSIDSTQASKSLVLPVEPNPLNLSAAGSPEIALVGEPAHVGDTLTASILVHNEGTSPQSVQLELIPRASTESIQTPILGDPILINPGSSREVSASFTPSSAGQIAIDWRVHSIDGGVARELNGSTTVEILESQSMTLVIDSTNWDLTNGLDAELSLYLSEGRSRAVTLEVAILDQTIETNLQSFELILDPGRRQLSLSLGDPSADSLIIKVEAVDWTASQNLGVHRTLTPPILDLEVDSAGVSTPPKTGERVSVPYELSNDGNTPTLSGEVRIVRTSDGMLLDSKNTAAVGPGDSTSGSLSIESWPDSKVVEVEIIWMTSGTSESKLLEIVTFSDAESGAKLPFDLAAAIYGAVSGLVLVMFILVLYRTVSERVADTGESRFNKLREARSERKKAQAAEKRQIPCPQCAQDLSIPATHSGAVKCPACTSRFTVEATVQPTQPTQPASPASPHQQESSSAQQQAAPTPLAEQPEPAQQSSLISRSMTDLLSCPSCDQTLKVPIERRPVKARCPACRSEFIAEVGGE